MKLIKVYLIFLLLLGTLSVSVAQTKLDALVLYRNGQFSQAIEVCLAEIEESPSNVESHVVLCWSLVEAKRYSEANSWAEKGRVLSKYDPRLIQIQAEATYYLGLNENSLRLFQEYISYAPNGSRISTVYFFMGEIYLRLSRFHHADMAFSAAVQLEPLRAQWWIRLGYAREMASAYRYSLEAYKKALSLDASLTDAQRGRDRVLAKL